MLVSILRVFGSLVVPLGRSCCAAGRRLRIGVIVCLRRVGCR